MMVGIGSNRKEHPIALLGQSHLRCLSQANLASHLGHCFKFSDETLE